MWIHAPWVTDLTLVVLHHLLAPLISTSATRLIELRVGGSLVRVHMDISWRETHAHAQSHTHTILWHLHFHNRTVHTVPKQLTEIMPVHHLSDATTETITFQCLLKRNLWSYMWTPHRHHAHLLETFLRRKCWRVPPGICQPQSLCGSFGSIQGDFCWSVGVRSMLPIDRRTDHTAASSRDCLALRTHYLLLLTEEGNKTKLG